MTIADFHALESRVAAGEQLTDEFRRLHSLARETIRDGDDVFPWAESFALAFQHRGLFPPLQAAIALVDVALAADETMPIVAPYDSQMKEALSPTERAEMFDYIAKRIGDNRSPQSFSAAADLADYLLDVG
ncbi:hypothetical protein [Sphingomonas alba]|uniref:Uncharacterized protein n=1 Tax=Sphingomonas alba TaxID=2908208 RepID=A0ABT0RJI5_9SPHN|nr:hypothetical protein [Sphingomonas alba]MCL6682760.1 hypothetical protein [Sphingomonas alba]